jgi:uncharacterized membrane protein YccC
MAPTPATTPAAPPPASHAADTRHALRVALACAICFVLVEWWHLSHANLAVWTTYMVMAQWTFTIFQKGIERIVGRGVGILAGVVLVTVLPDIWLLRHVLEVLLLMTFFYLFFANRLAYTFQNAGLYLIAIVKIGENNPAQALPEGQAMFLAVAVGVVVADLVSWFTGAEHDLHIQASGGRLWPIRADWLSHSLMLVTTALFVLVLTDWLELPIEQAIFSVFMISLTPHVQAALQKGELRLLGALLAIAWAGVTFLFEAHVPRLPVMILLLFFGIFLATYLARVGRSFSYAGVQMGLVLPLLVVVPPGEFGDLGSAWQRIQGIFAALFAMLLIGSLWPYFLPLAPPPSP